MADSNLVDVFDAADYLLREFARLLFLQPLPLNDVVEQLTAARVLHNQEQLATSLDNLLPVKLCLCHLPRRAESHLDGEQS